MEVKKCGVAMYDNNEMSGKQGARDVFDARFRMAKRFEEKSPEDSKSVGRRRGRKSTKGNANIT